ncbi:nucleoid occlusion protein, partial [Bacillus spizizenii]|nr:nucleoid occlusion protein [Bacillus spizizenii]
GQSTIANKLRLLKLPQPVQDAIMEMKITERHARALIPLKQPELQVTLLTEFIEKSLIVKQTEDRGVKMLEHGQRKPKPRRK